ncbi:MAG: hypothetical protein CMJ81_15175 [Planctomycetaceae bacterium]|nr:hypothetical protein [Planctomycetaceae bacterium]MBP62076.1 hypothetical protein [Planctomycetaceae bacterium]
MNSPKPYHPFAEVVLVACACLAWLPPLAGQDTTESDSSAGTQSQSAPAIKDKSLPVIETVGPVVHLLESQNGDLVPVPDLQYEDFMELIKIREGLSPATLPASFSVQNIEAEGSVQRGKATLQVRIQVVTHQQDWVRIPLGLNEAHMLEPLEHENAFMVFEPEGEGFVCYLESQPHQRHELKLAVAVPVSRIGPESRLVLNLPRVPHSHLRLKVPESQINATVSADALLKEEIRTSEDGQSIIEANGIGGPFQLSWRRDRPRQEKRRMVFEAKGNILVNVRGLNRVTSEARLRLRSFGRPLSRVRVRIPAASRLMPGSRSIGYTLEEIPSDVEAGEANEGQLVEVRFEDKSMTPPEVRLLTETVKESIGLAQSFDVSRFEVLGAAQQSGYIALASGSDVYPEWDLTAAIRQVNELPETFQSENVLAGFRYFRQPSSLKLRVVPRQSRISIEPYYILRVEADRVHLEATFNTTIRGARASFLNIEMSDWEILDLGPANVINKNSHVSERTSPLIVPLERGSGSNFQLVVKAVHRITSTDDSRQVRVKLPQPLVSTLQTASVAIVPEDNIALAALPAEMVGLIPDPAPIVPEKLQKRRQRTVFYRGTNDSAPPLFVADFDVRKRSVTVRIESIADLREERVQVQQKLHYQIEHESIHQLNLKFAELPGENLPLKVQLDGQPTSAFLFAVSQNESNPEQQAELYVTLPKERKGDVMLTIEYERPWSECLTKAGDGLDVPLFVPGQEPVSEHELQIRSGSPGGVIVADDRWTIDDPAEMKTPDQSLLALSSPGTADSVQLDFGPVTQEKRGKTVVEAAWVQTWVSDELRQDRASFYLQSRNSNLQIRMPSGVNLTDTIVKLDGQSVTAIREKQDLLEIRLPSSRPQESNLVELWYSFNGHRNAFGEMRVQLPQIENAQWTRQIYWQLVLPRREFLVDFPTGWTPEFNRQWNTLFVGRNTNFTADLESEMKVSWRGLPRARWLTNQYLFTCYADMKPIKVRTISQRTALLVFGGCALVAGLLVIRVPQFRHPLVLLIGAMMFLTFVAVNPEVAALIAQGAVVGLVMAFLGSLIQWFILWRNRGEGIVNGSTASLIERFGTDFHRVVKDDEQLGSTRTSAGSVPDSQSV